MMICRALWQPCDLEGSARFVMKMGGDGGRRVADGEAGVEAGEDGW